MEDADCVVLPEFWGHADRSIVDDLRAAAAGHDCAFAMFAAGDPEPRIPFDGAALVHPGIHRSAPRRGFASSLPVTCADRLYLRGGFRARTKGSRPVVDKTEVVPTPLRDHIWLRGRALEALAEDHRIDDNFIIRERYRVGAHFEQLLASAI